MNASRQWVLAALVTLLVLLYLGLLSLTYLLQQSPSAAPAVVTVEASSAPQSIVYSELAGRLVALTPEQRDYYLKSLVGARVVVSGTIREVYAIGRLDLTSGGCQWYCILVENVPQNVTLSLKPNRTVAIVGTVTDYSAAVPAWPTLWIHFESLR